MARTPLSEVLVQMGVVTQQRLNDITDRLSSSTEEEKFGKMLLAHGVISEEQLEEAWRMLRDLEAPDKTVRALAAATLAEQHTTSVYRLAHHVKRRAIESRTRTESEHKRQTGQDNVVVTLAMLGKRSQAE